MTKPGRTRLEKLIAAKITDGGGWIDFEEFMRMALHEPYLGYYATDKVPVGPTGDFITAPEAGELFARCLAEFISANLPAGGKVLELGPGSGQLAVSLLKELAKKTNENVPDYLLLETSPGLRIAQQERLQQEGVERHCHWLDDLPDNFVGVMIGNEVLDTLPCRVLVKRDGHWLRRGVSVNEQGDFIWRDGTKAQPDDKKRLDEFDLPDGFCAEINRQAEALAATAASKLASGVILWIDYGFERRELYHPQRSTGTLMSHRRQMSSVDVLASPGSQDITSHVDFSAMAQASIDAGATLVGFATQASFLLDLGIDSKASFLEDASLVARANLSRELQTLLMPHEMGEFFKALAMSRNHAPSPNGFRLRGSML